MTHTIIGAIALAILCLIFCIHTYFYHLASIKEEKRIKCINLIRKMDNLEKNIDMIDPRIKTKTIMNTLRNKIQRMTAEIARLGGGKGTPIKLSHTNNALTTTIFVKFNSIEEVDSFTQSAYRLKWLLQKELKLESAYSKDVIILKDIQYLNECIFVGELRRQELTGNTMLSNQQYSLAKLLFEKIISSFNANPAYKYQFIDLIQDVDFKLLHIESELNKQKEVFDSDKKTVDEKKSKLMPNNDGLTTFFNKDKSKILLQ